MRLPALFLHFTLLMMFIGGICRLSAQPFTKTYGGPKDDVATCVVETRDGNVLLAGYTYSFSKGSTDVWLLKLKPTGEELWRQSIGKEGQEWPNALIETRDGGMVVAGYTRDVKTRQNNAWVFKLDKTGKMLWEKTYGGALADEAKAIVETDGGGYVVAGSSRSFSNGQSDMWLLRIAPNGDELWQRNFGKDSTEQANALLVMANGDFLLAGYTESLGAGKKDMLLVCVSANGKEKWMRPFGTAGDEEADALVRTSDGNYAMAGWTGSATKGKQDGKVIKFSSDGNLIWEKTMGGTEEDAIQALAPTPDGGVVCVGKSRSYGTTMQLWGVKLAESGKIVWERNFGGEKGDVGTAVTALKAGGYLMAGGTYSTGAGMADFWAIRTDENGSYEDEIAQPVASTPASSTVAASNTSPNSSAPTPVATPTPTPAVAPSTPVAALANAMSDLLKPNLYILSIGVSKYQDESVNLTYAHVDAESVADKFSEMQGKLFNQVHARKILNEEATLINIKTGIAWLEEQATQKDVILIFLSSHGALDHKGNLYILPTDFNPYNLFATALNIKDLTDGMSGAPCKKLILLDACHSGQSGADLLASKSVNVEKIVQEVLDAEPGLTVMTSSSGKEYSYETKRWGHGAFTRAILDGLDPATQPNADYNKNGVVTLLELNLYVTTRVKELTAGKQHPFTPINLFGDIPLFIME
jgi:uncharacterized caspase-like protein